MDLSWYKKLEWYAKYDGNPHVLFVCSGNTCRSPSAEYYFKTKAAWMPNATAFSRGVNVSKTLSDLRSRGIPITKLLTGDIVKKIVGDPQGKIVSRYGKQLKAEDLTLANLVLTMEGDMRDALRKKYPYEAYKIFTLKGFVNQNERGDVDFPNPFVPPPVLVKKGVTTNIDGRPGNPKLYRDYVTNYRDVLVSIGVAVQKLVEILYLIGEDKWQ